jgi:hypothetical protein
MLSLKNNGRKKIIKRNNFSPMIIVKGILLLNKFASYAEGNFGVKTKFQRRIGNNAM